MTQLAQKGSPEVAALLLNLHRNPAPADYSEYLPKPDPIFDPVQFKKAAYNGNAALFRYLVTDHPILLTTYNPNVEAILISAMMGGVPIWKIILVVEPGRKDTEFSKCYRYVPKKILWIGQRVAGDTRKIFLQFLLEEGALTDRASTLILEAFICIGASKDIIEQVWKYS